MSGQIDKMSDQNEDLKGRFLLKEKNYSSPGLPGTNPAGSQGRWPCMNSRIQVQYHSAIVLALPLWLFIMMAELG